MSVFVCVHLCTCVCTQNRIEHPLPQYAHIHSGQLYAELGVDRRDHMWREADRQEPGTGENIQQMNMTVTDMVR